MKKKLLMIIMVAVLAILAATIFTACKETRFNVTVTTPSDGWLSIDDSKGFPSYGQLAEGTKLEYTFRLKDHMDISTLKMYVNGTETAFTKNPDYVTPSTMTGNTDFVVGSYTIESLSQDTEITFDCQERDVVFNFSYAEGAANATEIQKSIVGGFVIDDGTALGLSLNTAADDATDIQYITNFSELVASNWAIPMKTSYNPGALNIGEFITVNNYSGFMYDSNQDNLNACKLRISNGGGTINAVNEIKVDPSAVSFNDFEVRLVTQGSVLSFAHTAANTTQKTVNARNGSFIVNINTDIVGADFSNAKLVIGEKVVMGAGTDTPIDADNNTFLLTALSTNAPINFNQEGDITPYQTYWIKLIDVEYPEDSFYKVSYNHDSLVLPDTNKVEYSIDEKYSYYSLEDYPSGLTATFDILNHSDIFSLTVIYPDGEEFENTFDFFKNGTMSSDPYHQYTTTHKGVTYVLECDSEGTLLRLTIQLTTGSYSILIN